MNEKTSKLAVAVMITISVVVIAAMSLMAYTSWTISHPRCEEYTPYDFKNGRVPVKCMTDEERQRWNAENEYN